MAKQNEALLSDELIADSLQVINYLEQIRQYRIHVLHLGVEQWLTQYFNRYKEASPELKFKIFLFSRFYSRRMEGVLEEIRGDQFV